MLHAGYRFGMAPGPEGDIISGPFLLKVAHMDAADITRLEAERARYEAYLEMVRPSYLYKPTLYCKNDLWIAEYGERGRGVYAIGSTPDGAYRNFDKAWYDALG